MKIERLWVQSPPYSPSLSFHHQILSQLSITLFCLPLVSNFLSGCLGEILMFPLFIVWVGWPIIIPLVTNLYVFIACGPITLYLIYKGYVLVKQNWRSVCISHRIYLLLADCYFRHNQSRRTYLHYNYTQYTSTCPPLVALSSHYVAPKIPLLALCRYNLTFLSFPFTPLSSLRRPFRTLLPSSFTRI